MAFLARALDDPGHLPCGRCAVCRGRPILPEAYSAALAAKAVQFLQRNDQWIEPRTQWPAGALAAHRWQGSIPAGLQAEPGRTLCRWGDDGWGSLVRKGKQVANNPDERLVAMVFTTLKKLLTGRHPTVFDERLVAAVVAMVRERWRPEPSPTWVTCVPSLNHPTLVPDFARRLAQEFRLPFVLCVRKLHPTRPQKEMQNNYHQAHNLEDAFAVDSGSVRAEPVLLVDDMVDSRWTFTVVAAHLRRAGSGPVFPLALAVTTRTGDG